MSAVVITAGAQAKAGTEGATAGASAGPATGTQAEIGYTKGLAVFVHTKGGLMYEAAIGGQKFDFTPFNANQVMKSVWIPLRTRPFPGSTSSSTSKFFFSRFPVPLPS